MDFENVLFLMVMVNNLCRQYNKRAVLNKRHQICDK